MLSQEYKNNPRMSQSRLKHILDGIEEFKWHLDNPPEETDAMRLGSAVHLLLLQPEKEEHIVEAPQFDGRSKQGKHWKYLLESKPQSLVDLLDYYGNLPSVEQNFICDTFNTYEAALVNPDDYILLPSEQYAKAHDMVAAIRRNSDAMQIIDSCEAFEQEHYFTYRGVDFKAQVDGLGSNFVVDVKTTRCENKEFKIRNEILNQGYHFQAATYLQATGKQNYYIIFVRNEPPHAVFPVKLSFQTISDGFDLLNDACDLYKECLQNNPDFIPNNKLRII